MAQPHTTAAEGAATRSFDLPAWVHSFAWGVTILLAVVLVGLSNNVQNPNVWEGWRESSELRRPVYAERVYMNAVFRTRANAWSNLAYVLVGLYGIAIGWHDLRCRHPANGNYVICTPAMSILFGVTCCYLGFGSGLFHASLTHWGQQLDVAAMYSPLTVFIAINVGRWIPCLKTEGRGGSLPTWPILVGLVLVASFLLYEYKWSIRSGVVMRNLILAVACFALLDRFQRRCKLAIRWLLLSTTALVLGRFCWQLDVAGKFSGPDARLQGHAMWHLLTALSLASMYLYYRSEANCEGSATCIGPEIT
jgi:hypothetical protein